MADATSSPQRPARDWTAAFAALPEAAPPADGWARIAQALDTDAAAGARAHRGRRRSRRGLTGLLGLAGLAAAATLAALALLPVWRGPALQTPTSTPAATPLAQRREPATSTPAVSAARGTVRAAPSAQRQVANAATPDPVPAPRARVTPARRTAATTAAKAARRDGTHRATPVIAAGIAAADAQANPITSPITNPIATPITTPIAEVAEALAADTAADATPPLAALQAESSRLEALVALARDDAATSASGLVLAAGLDERIGLIDAALSQPVLGADERGALWRQRVTALRELAGIETTQRWYAARGQRYDDALVRVD